MAQKNKALWIEVQAAIVLVVLSLLNFAVVATVEGTACFLLATWLVRKFKLRRIGWVVAISYWVGSTYMTLVAFSVAVFLSFHFIGSNLTVHYEGDLILANAVCWLFALFATAYVGILFLSAGVWFQKDCLKLQTSR